jgi:hypothetical protein
MGGKFFAAGYQIARLTLLCEFVNPYKFSPAVSLSCSLNLVRGFDDL